MNKKIFLALILLFSLDLYANPLESITNIDFTDDNLTLWIAIFGLGLIAVFALFLSSENIEKFKNRQRKEEEELQKEYEKQGEIVSKIGESIYDIAKESAATSSSSTYVANPSL